MPRFPGAEEARPLTRFDIDETSSFSTAENDTKAPLIPEPSPSWDATWARRRWMALVACMWVQAFAGNGYMFPHFSHLLKSVLSYNQLQLNNLGVAKDIGENVGVLAGLLCNRLPPWFILLIGALNGFLGYGVVWLVASHKIDRLPFWLMCATLCIGANSSTWFNTVALVTCMRNFPNSRGTVAGFLKGFVGLSGAIFTQLFAGFLAKDPMKLLLFLAVAPTLVCLAAMRFVRSVPGDLQPNDSAENAKFFIVHIICLVLAVLLLLATLFDDLIPVDRHVVDTATATLMLLILLAPLCIFTTNFASSYSADAQTVEECAVDVLKEPLVGTLNSGMHDCSRDKEGLNDMQEAEAHRHTTSSSSQLQMEADKVDVMMLMAVAEGAVKRRRGPRRGEDFNLQQALVKADFWLLFFTFFCGVGTGITAINNLGQIGAAQGYRDVSVFISLIGIFNFLGRLGGGSISEHYVRSSAIPRPVWMAIAQVIMIVAHLLFASAIDGTLHAASALLGFCYGVQFSVMVPTASELFGLKNFGIIFNFLTMANPLGSLLFSGLLAGYLYDREAEKQNPPSSDIGVEADYFSSSSIFARAVDKECTGVSCFRLTFLLMAGVCVVGIMLCFLLVLRISPVYKALNAARDRNNSSASLPSTGNLSCSSLQSIQKS